MEHHANCKCQACASELWLNKYTSKAYTFTAKSVEFDGHDWYVHYTGTARNDRRNPTPLPVIESRMTVKDWNRNVRTHMWSGGHGR